MKKQPRDLQKEATAALSEIEREAQQLTPELRAAMRSLLKASPLKRGRRPGDSLTDAELKQRAAAMRAQIDNLKRQYAKSHHIKLSDVGAIEKGVSLDQLGKAKAHKDKREREIDWVKKIDRILHPEKVAKVKARSEGRKKNSST